MEKLIKKAYENATKFGVYIDLLEEGEGYFTVYANSSSIVVYDDGACSVWDSEGFRVKDYTGMGYGFKKISNMGYEY